MRTGKKTVAKVAETTHRSNLKKDGRVKLVEAKVTGITGNTVTAETVRGATTTVWTLVTSSSTDFMLKNSRSATLADVAVGDRINSDGVLTATSSTVINASVVRILKDKKVTPVVLSRHIFDGTLASLSGSNTPATLGLTMGSTTYLVNVPAGTLILGKNWLLSNLSNFSIGNNVRIFGSLASSTSNIINAVVVRNATNN